MDLSSFVQYHRKHIQGVRQRRDEARRVAFQALERMVPIFKTAPGLKRVYLFGSLNRSHFREDSDIDLAVEGLSPKAFLELSSQMQKLTSRQVDPIDLADCDRPFKEFIRKFGRLIYEQSS